MKKIASLLIPIFVLFGCEQKPPTTDKISGDAAFQKLTDDYLAGYLAWRPQLGVALGYHQYDGKITDVSKESLGKELGRLKDFDQKLAAMDTVSLSPKMFYDLRILQSAIKNDIFSFEDLGAFNKNPMPYVQALDVSIYIKRDFAPIQDRIKSIIDIEKKAPEFFAAAKINLKDSLPKPYVQLAIEIAHGSAAFLGGDLKSCPKRCEE